MSLPRAPKSVVVKVFRPGNRMIERRLVLRAPAGKVWTEAGVQQQLEKVADMVDHAFPGEVYEMVELNSREFNIVWRARRESPPAVSAAAGT